MVEREAKVIQRPQGAADKEIDEQNIEAKEQSEHDEAVAEIVPDFEDLIARVGLIRMLL